MFKHELYKALGSIELTLLVLIMDARGLSKELCSFLFKT